MLKGLLEEEGGGGGGGEGRGRRRRRRRKSKKKKKRKKKKKKQTKKPRGQQSNNKMALCTYLSVITLNVNGLNAPTKRHRGAEWIKKQDPYICCLQEAHLRLKDS